MADAKLSSFPVAVTINAIDYLPVLQNSANKLATAGQLKTYVNTLSSTSVTGAAIPLTSDVVGVAGSCTLANATTTVKITIIATAAGSVTFTGGSYTFTTGNTLDLVWFASKWNVLSVQGMV